jgi:arsenate reductase
MEGPGPSGLQKGEKDPMRPNTGENREAPDPTGLQKVIFLCTYNSVRSQMAEAILRHIAGDRYMVFSAGITSTMVSPRAVRVLDEAGISTQGLYSKSIQKFWGEEFDYVVTVCATVNKVCPTLPGGKKFIHRSFPSPPEHGENEEVVLEGFRQLRDQIRTWVDRTFVK